LLASVDEGWGNTELSHVLAHNTVVSDVEGAFEVGVHNVDVFVVYFRVLHHHYDGG
jgi:uncharacterized protein YktA (UPF0223 family)